MAKRGREDSISNNAASSKDDTYRNISVEAMAHTPKYAEIDIPEDREPVIHCLLPPHKPMAFPTYDAYEDHYRQAHTNRCQACRKNFPTEHFLDLHLTENHDPIAAMRRDQGEKIFACLVEDCDKLCSEWTKRRRHLIDKHGFPRNYDFFVVNSGIDGRRSMLRLGVDEHGHRKSSRERSNSSTAEITQTIEQSECIGEADVRKSVRDVEHSKSAERLSKVISEQQTTVEDITQSMSSLKFVPSSVSFGKRKGRSGFAKS